VSQGFLAIDDALTLKAGRQLYFERSGIEPGYDARWVTLRAGRVPVLVFPNTAGRVRAVRLRDLHHVVTGYETTWTGEAEIAAWEIATGCGSFFAAWVLNLGAFVVGLVIAPRRLFRAFVRGRRSENLYLTAREYDDAILDGTVGQLRAKLQLDSVPSRATASDAATFAFWVVAAIVHATYIPAIVIFALS